MIQNERIKIKPVFIGLQFAGKSPTFVHLLHVLGDVFRFLFCPDNSTRRPHKHQVNWSAKQAFYQTCNWKEFAGIEPARSTQPTTRPQVQTNIINSRIICVKEIESNSDIKWFHSKPLYFKCPEEFVAASNYQLLSKFTLETNFCCFLVVIKPPWPSKASFSLSWQTPLQPRLQSFIIWYFAASRPSKVDSAD